MDAYPYIVSNNKIEPILAKIRSAARPERLTLEILKKWGFAASNDRAMLRVLKALDFLDDNGAPTPHYDRLRDQNDWRYVLGERLRETYADLYAIDEKIHAAPETEVKGAISRVTGKDEALVNRYLSTFKALAGLAKFDAPTTTRKQTPPREQDADQAPLPPTRTEPAAPQVHTKTSLHYNIQIHLPATTDVGVYNAIFKSLRDNLLV